MDSRLIYESSKTYIQNVTWTKPSGVDSEWLHIGTGDNIAAVEKIIRDYFITDDLYVAINRQESFEINKEFIAERIRPLIGKEDFSIWNWTFQKVIEFNKIGVYRTGISAIH